MKLSITETTETLLDITHALGTMRSTLERNLDAPDDTKFTWRVFHNSKDGWVQTFMVHGNDRDHLTDSIFTMIKDRG